MLIGEMIVTVDGRWDGSKRRSLVKIRKRRLRRERRIARRQKRMKKIFKIRRGDT